MSNHDGKTGKPAARATSDRVLVEVTISAPIDAVWQALREPDQVAQWFGWGGPTAQAEIDAIFTQSAAADFDRQTIQFVGTNDRFELLSTDGGTIVRVVRSGLAEDDWSDIYEEMTEGWISFTHQLKHMVENYNGGVRQILHLSGTLKAPVESEFLGLLSERLLHLSAADGEAIDKGPPLAFIGRPIKSAYGSERLWTGLSSASRALQHRMSLPAAP